MTRAQKKLDETKCYKAILHVVSQGGVDALTFKAVAQKLKLEPKVLSDRFGGDPKAMVAAVVEGVTREALGLFVADEGETSQDRLFDALMARFDVMQKKRKVFLVIAKAARHDAVMGRVLAASVLQAMGETARGCGLTRPSRSLWACAVLAVYTRAFWVWRKDTTKDMAKTMAALDRSIKIGGDLLAWFEKFKQNS